MSKLKIKFKGKWFWLRSMIITVIMETLMIFILFAISFSHKKLPVGWVTIVLTTIVYDLLVAAVLSGIASFYKPILIKHTGCDVYDHEENYNPFAFAKKTTNTN